MAFVYFVLGNMCVWILGDSMFGYNTNFWGLLVNIFFLNGIFPAFNNNVVRGGWYVGTTVILYLLTPIMFKLFSLNKPLWNKIKIWCFPLIISSLGIAVMMIFNLLFPQYYCSNNSFWYFSFVNQIAPYSLGFSLYELYKTGKIQKIKMAPVFSIVFLLFSIFLFYSGIKFAFVFLPIIFGISFLYIQKIKVG